MYEYMVVTFCKMQDTQLQMELNRLLELRWKLVTINSENQYFFIREK